MKELLNYKNILKFKIIILFFFVLYFLRKLNSLYSKSKFDINFEYHNYQRQMISERMKKYSFWQIGGEEPYFINGIIRKYKPKKCLEIGVAAGGSSIIILNAIKDIKNSFLIIV